MDILKEKQKNKITKKDLINFGLFENVKEKHMAAITKLFNRALKICLKHEKNKEKIIEVLIFPCIMRIYKISDILKIDIENLYYELSNFFEQNKSKIIEINIIGADGEAELLAAFTDDYIIKLKENK